MPAKILSVDDSKTIRMLVAKAFRPYDCIVLEAGNGEEGLAVAQRERPDLIILDVTMPIMDGVTMLSKLKEDPDLKQIPVVMLTAESGRDNVMHIARLGARDYLVKPFKEDQLLAKITRIISLQPKGAGSAN
ncbi:MAG: response regulator [Verrucomicrobiota bacterium]|nr:response regulator [Limisphaera sp.]MDW8380896.1 response regulator [Verrucomicrobiota bacterium]